MIAPSAILMVASAWLSVIATPGAFVSKTCDAEITAALRLPLMSTTLPTGTLTDTEPSALTAGDTTNVNTLPTSPSATLGVKAPFTPLATTISSASNPRTATPKVKVNSTSPPAILIVATALSSRI